MSVNINNVALKDMNFNGYPVKKWLHNGVTVWERFSVIEASCTGSYGSLCYANGVKVWPTSSSAVRSEIPEGSCISWYETCCRWIAEEDCEVTITGNIKLTASEGTYFWMYRDCTGLNKKTLIYAFTASSTATISDTFSMKKGDIAYLSCRAGRTGSASAESNYRGSFNGTVNISALSCGSC